MKISILVTSLLSLGASALPEAEVEESITVGEYTYTGGELPKGELKAMQLLALHGHWGYLQTWPLQLLRQQWLLFMQWRTISVPAGTWFHRMPPINNMSIVKSGGKAHGHHTNLRGHGGVTCDDLRP
ncbi:hypothetical protein E4U16_003642 [Claviceps sp. LM84 group G4]|nr:hypothetical protein E4U16_003642 [Claviceps sp. LM84 group G4]